MSQILILLALPIGIVFLFADLRQQKINRQIAETFIEEVKANKGLSDAEKIGHLKKMFQLNRFMIEHLDDHSLVASRKHLNIGAAIIAFAVVPLYLGVLFFILYFVFVKKPERWEVDLSASESPDTQYTASFPV